jgi:rubrerythrin
VKPASIRFSSTGEAAAGPIAVSLVRCRFGHYTSEGKITTEAGDMDIYGYAMQMEKDGEKYYRDGAARSANKGLKNILGVLADAEVKHYNLFEQMKQNRPVQVGDTAILQDVKNVFVKMKEEGGFKGISASEAELYRKAQEIEKQTEDFYLEKASVVTDAGQKDALLRIAAEENKHYFILDQIINFVTRPDHWLENAEWYHLDEY